MAIVRQYLSFISLVLHDVHGGCPIFPFDPSSGLSGNHAYHYHPAVSILQLPNDLGYALSHYQDNDSRRISCLQCDDSVLSDSPDLLTDAVTQGFAAWGGRLLTSAQALTLARILQPTYSVTLFEFDPQNPETQILKTKTYGTVSLDNDDILTRTVTIE
jgi:hypothetical protein